MNLIGSGLCGPVFLCSLTKISFGGITTYNRKCFAELRPAAYMDSVILFP